MGEKGALRGTLLMLVSSVFFCIMSGLIRHAADIDSFMVVQFRFVIGLALLSSAAMFGWIRLSFVHSKLLFLRGLVGSSAVFLFFLSISKLGIGKGTVISYSFPAFASVFGALLLGERLTPVKVLAVAAALVGIGLLAFRGGGEAGGEEAASVLASLGTYELLAILGAALSGVAICLVKKLHSTDSTYAIFFAQCLVGLWLVIIPANARGASLDYVDGLTLLGIGVVSATAQLLMTEGYRHLTVTTGSLLGMTVPVFNFAVGATIFDEPMSARGWLGSAIVIGSCCAVILADRRKSSGTTAGTADETTDQHR